MMICGRARATSRAKARKCNSKSWETSWSIKCRLLSSSPPSGPSIKQNPTTATINNRQSYPVLEACMGRCPNMKYIEDIKHVRGEVHLESYRAWKWLISLINILAFGFIWKLWICSFKWGMAACSPLTNDWDLFQNVEVTWLRPAHSESQKITQSLIRSEMY